MKRIEILKISLGLIRIQKGKKPRIRALRHDGTVCCLYYTLKVHKKFLANNKFTKEAIPSLQIPHGIQNFQNLKNSVSKLRNWDKLCTLIFDETLMMSIMLHVGDDINEFKVSKWIVQN
jgi:hypothetical protein